MLPFSREAFLGAFERYNAAIGPVPWLLVTIACVLVLAAITGPRSNSRLTSALLALLWAWTGVVYHALFFRAVTPAALLFAALFLAQAALLARAAVHGGVSYHADHDWRGVAGWLLIAYALAIYPLLSGLLGHEYPASPTFGAPCPVTLLTLGVLAWARPAPPLRLVVAPVLWALIGTSAALQLGMLEDLALPVGAALVLALASGGRLVHRHPRLARS